MYNILYIHVYIYTYNICICVYLLKNIIHIYLYIYIPKCVYIGNFILSKDEVHLTRINQHYNTLIGTNVTAGVDTVDNRLPDDQQAESEIIDNDEEEEDNEGKINEGVEEEKKESREYSPVNLIIHVDTDINRCMIVDNLLEEKEEEEEKEEVEEGKIRRLRYNVIQVNVGNVTYKQLQRAKKLNGK